MTMKEVILKELEGIPEEKMGKILAYIKDLKEEPIPQEKEGSYSWIPEYRGVIKTKIQDPVKWQRQIRDEWEN